MVVSAPFAALPNVTASAASSDYTEDGVPSIQADISVVEETYNLKRGTVTATAKVGDSELANDKVILNEKVYSVTIVVSNDTSNTPANTYTPSNNPNTGVAVAAVPVVIAVSAAVIIISKKKK